MSSHQTRKYRGVVCQNCEHPLDISDKFCCNCGQINSNKRLSMKDFANEFFANFYAYDSKINNTLRSLFTKPGKMALEFVSGKKNSYANPFRFYLSVSLIFFILSGFVKQWDDVELIGNQNYEIIDNPIEIKLEEPNQMIDSVLIVNENILIKEMKKDSLKMQVLNLKNENLLKRNLSKLSIFESYILTEPDYNQTKALSELGLPTTKWNKFLFKKSKELNSIFEDSNPDQKNQFLLYLYSKLPFLLFISIPFLTLCFSIVYLRSHYHYAEHLVFVFSNMAFLFLLLLINEFQQIFTNASLNGLIFFGYSFYFYKSLRNFYQQKRWKTILKFVILGFLLSIASSFTSIFVIMFSFFLY
jgi:hypothetical protein